MTTTKSWLWGSATVVAVVVAIFLAGPQTVGLVVAAALAIALSVAHPSVPTHATLILAFTALPVETARSVEISGLSSIYLYEITLVLAAIGWLVKGKANRRLDLTAAALVLLVLFGAVLSSIGGIATNAVIADSRRIIWVGVAVFVAGRAYASDHRVRYAYTFAASLWVSALGTMAASVGVIDLGQRELGASLDLSDTSAAVRLVTEATYPAVTALTIAVCLYVTGKLERRSVPLFVIPAVIIFLLSFSRNPILSIVLGAFVGLLLSRSVAGVVRLGKLTAVAAVVVATAWAAALLDQGGALSAWIDSQMSGFTERVFEGITADALATDSSTLYRTEQENPYLWTSFQSAPIFGSGLGFEYKPTYTGRGFASIEDAIRASRYAHNFYGWLAVKIGLVGAVLFLWFTLLPPARAIISAWKRATPALVGAFAAALLGLFAQSFVAPMPIGSPTNVLFGAVLGVVVAGIVKTPTTTDRAVTSAPDTAPMSSSIPARRFAMTGDR